MLAKNQKNEKPMTFGEPFRRAVLVYVLLQCAIAVMPYAWFPMAGSPFSDYSIGEYLLVAFLVLPSYVFGVLAWRAYRRLQRRLPGIVWLSTLPVALLISVVSRLLSPFEVTQPWTSEEVTARVLIALGVMLVHTVLLAPIWEEWVFREGLLPRNASSLALVTSAALFALVHPWGRVTPFLMDLHFHAITFLIGLSLAFLKQLTGNTWYVVVVHAVINLLAIVRIN